MLPVPPNSCISAFPLPENLLPPGSSVAVYVILPPPPQPPLPHPPCPCPENEPVILFVPEVIVKQPPNGKGGFDEKNQLPLNFPRYGPRALPLAPKPGPQPPPLPLVDVSLSVFLRRCKSAALWATELTAGVPLGARPEPCVGAIAAPLQPASTAMPAQTLNAYQAEIEIRIASLLGVNDASYASSSRQLYRGSELADTHK